MPINTNFAVIRQYHTEYWGNMPSPPPGALMG